jgi:tetratricopeptide (TPR) repeat protein
MTERRISELSKARTLAESGELDQSMRLAEHWLMENPNDIQALVVASFVLRRARKLPQAYHLSRRITELEPSEPAGWINFGQICNELFREQEAERAYKRGLATAKDADSRSKLYTNLSALMIDMGRFPEALKAAESSLEAKPQSNPARSNLGFCQLAAHDWGSGWKNYRACLGTEARKKTVYRDPAEPEWDGQAGQTVILYGEQGIGDEICFASMLPDAIRRADKLILDIDERLAGLFRRSFPQAKVYGTRNAKPGDEPWSMEDRQFDSSLAIAQIGEFFRQKDSDFPAGSYLTADPDRMLMWKALWAKKGKPVVGIAWTGGIWQTGAKFRKLTLEQLLPVFQSIDAHWVCLQYKDAAREIAAFRKAHPEVDLMQYPHGTLTSDYDDTAALVASLECVVSVPTAVVHAAGALGVPCLAMKAPHSCWKFYAGLPFHPEVQLIENEGNWDRTIIETAGALRKRMRQREAA